MAAASPRSTPSPPSRTARCGTQGEAEAEEIVHPPVAEAEHGHGCLERRGQGQRLFQGRQVGRVGDMPDAPGPDPRPFRGDPGRRAGVAGESKEDGDGFLLVIGNSLG